MAELNQYLKILTESLEKKKKIMESILAANVRQGQAIREKGDLETFDRIVSEKEKLINELMSLDNGFEEVYSRIAAELESRKSEFAAEIGKLQKLISEVTELSTRNQASEQRNKQGVESYFSYTRRQLNQNRKSVRAASDYYKSMNQLNAYSDVQMVDRKK